MISIIVPVYKAEAYLSKCLDSIIQQTYRDFEVILVDDGSPDNCGHICDQYAEQDMRIRVIHKSNGGVSEARNAGIREARGEYITFVDSDDWADSRLLEILWNGIEKGAQISVCGFYTVWDRLPKPWRKPSEEYHVMTGAEAARDMMYTHSLDTSAWGKLFHRSCFDNISFPVSCLYEEVATTYKLFMTQIAVAVTTQPLYYYVKHQGSIVASAYSHKHMDMMRFSGEMMSFAKEEAPELIPAAKRRMIYASCYLLKTMGNQYKEYPEDVKEILSVFRKYRKEVFRDPDVSRRDKAAIALLSVGPGVYVKAWNIYSGLTGRRGNT